MADKNIDKASGSESIACAALVDDVEASTEPYWSGYMPAPGAVIDHKYRIEHLIARGGMSAVFAASHCVSGKKVALKWMLPALGQIEGARERFMQEASATARIAHPNVVDIYDVGTEQGSAYLVMEYLRGETLADRLERVRLSPERAVGLLMPALRGVAEAHAHGIIHRDLKPDNIFLCCTAAGEELEPTVLDFGISKITNDEARDLALTHSGTVLGTPYYMAPEQLRGSREIDIRVDVYSIGVILFEMLAGQKPFDADTYNDLIIKIATEEPQRLSELAPEVAPKLVAIIERAMARDPGDRFASIGELALLLEEFSGGVRFHTHFASAASQTFLRDRPSAAGIVLRPTTPPPLRVPMRVAPAGQARGLVSLATALVTLSLGIGGVSYIASRTSQQPRTSRPTTLATHAASPVTTLTANDPRGTDSCGTNGAACEPSAPALAITATPVDVATTAPDESKHAHGAAADGAKRPGEKRGRRVGHEPPAPQSAAHEPPAANVPAALTAPKRATLRDWEERIRFIENEPSGKAPNAPAAGPIDARDFR